MRDVRKNLRETISANDLSPTTPKTSTSQKSFWFFGKSKSISLTTNHRNSQKSNHQSEYHSTTYDNNDVDSSIADNSAAKTSPISQNPINDLSITPTEARSTTTRISRSLSATQSEKISSREDQLCIEKF
ncbi:hypothetical protein Tcan_02053 [Toxocara canis]|uniref:Uncharacterized protein n=1 Tax=Toxocara canis TaxID=6265 RepID=A0A0B2URI1_TOXCA|nr:hypothetical protein Tcan_02053 [Toxocara canis]